MQLKRIYKRPFFLILSTFIFCGTAFATGNSSDSLTTKIKYRFIFKLDIRNSFLSHYDIQIGGIRTGVEWSKRWRAGLGYSTLLKNTRGIRSYLNSNRRDSAYYRLNFSYVSVFGEYVSLNRRRWEVATSLSIGMGSIYFNVNTSNGTTEKTPKLAALVVEPYVSAHYKVFNWIGVGAGLGYRTMFDRDPARYVQQHFNAPFYVIKVKLFLRDLYKDIRRPHFLKNITSIDTPR